MADLNQATELVILKLKYSHLKHRLKSAYFFAIGNLATALLAIICLFWQSGQQAAERSESAQASIAITQFYTARYDSLDSAYRSRIAVCEYLNRRLYSDLLDTLTNYPR